MPESKKAESGGLPRRSKLKEIEPVRESSGIDLIALILLFVALVANIVVLLSLL